MKKLLLTSCLVVLCASSLKAEEVQQQESWKEKVAKYSKIVVKGAFLDLCVHNLYTKLSLRNLPNKLAFDDRNRNIIITSIAGCIVAKSIYNDLTK